MKSSWSDAPSITYTAWTPRPVGRSGLTIKWAEVCGPRVRVMALSSSNPSSYIPVPQTMKASVIR